MKRLLIFLLILVLCNVVTAADSFTLNYDSEFKKSIWRGVPDSNYVLDGGRLSYERIVKDENGKDVTVKTYKKPIEIIADFKPESKVFGIEGNIERIAVKKFGGALKGFVWLDKVSGGGEVVLPFTAPHIFIARGDRLNPVLTEIGTDPNSDNYYEIFEGKTHVFVKSFSGIGGAVGAPPTLIAHYKMNDKLATTVVIDETGNHNGTAQQNTSAISVAGKINGAFNFNGSSDYIDCGDDADFAVVGNLSISVWINPVTISGEHKIVDRSFSITSGYSLYQIDDVVRFSIANGGSGSRKTAEYGDILIQNQWHHIVGTWDGSTIRIFVNGIEGDSQAQTGPLDDAGKPLTIGKRADQDSLYFSGLIDNVMLFSKELDSGEVGFLYNGSAGREGWNKTVYRGRYSGFYRQPYRNRYLFQN